MPANDLEAGKDKFLSASLYVLEPNGQLFVVCSLRLELKAL